MKHIETELISDGIEGRWSYLRPVKISLARQVVESIAFGMFIAVLLYTLWLAAVVVFA